MLWVLRKVFRVIALAWVVLLLLFWITCVASPKSSGYAFFDIYFASFVGVPACIIWAVLKIIDVMGKSRAQQPAPAKVEYPSAQVSPNSVLGLLGPVAPVPKPKPSENPNRRAEPDVYTYSAPGMPMCPRCNQRPTIFYCKTHQVGVCLECVAKHDDRESCVYVPAFRA